MAYLVEQTDVFVRWLSGLRDGNPPVFNGGQKWSYAAAASRCMGVMPPSAMFGRS